MTVVRLAFDPVLMRPACVLVAAAMGADTAPVHRFDPRDWLLAPTPDMRVFPTTREQLQVLVKKVAERRHP